MSSILLAFGTLALYFIAYHTYGKFLARKIFRLDPDATPPSVELQDNVDYVPTKKSIVFGNHFTAIAGVGPIVGPAVAIIWGWVPAMLWIVFGSIFMGAVHDFGSLVVSMRNKGRSIGDLTSEVVNRRVRIIFLLIIFFLIWLVVAVFGVVIGIVFKLYPESVMPVWMQIPISLWLGYMVTKRNANHNVMALIAVAIMYGTIILGAHFPLVMPSVFGVGPIGVWVVLLLGYCYFASVLPVQVLLQPRGFINAYQLIVALAMLALGILVSNPPIVAPALNLDIPDAPSIWPMLFVIIACGAVSGFHSLISSGTSSKQCDNEMSALNIGYGSMLTEGVMATLVVIACAAGLGLGLKIADGEVLHGVAAFNHQYSSWGAAAGGGLGAKINAFVMGSANMMESIGITPKYTFSIMGVFIASFAVTSLDTAMRIQRYTVAEIANVIKVPFLAKNHPASIIAAGSALLLAFSTGTSGTGALKLWPLFGSCNQLLAGLALMVVTVYLARKRYPVIFTGIPMVFMLAMTGWAMKINLIDFYNGGQWMLFVLGAIIVVLEIWMVVESVLVMLKIYSEEPTKTAAG